jgi:hypothetical protein
MLFSVWPIMAFRSWPLFGTYNVRHFRAVIPFALPSPLVLHVLTFVSRRLIFPTLGGSQAWDLLLGVGILLRRVWNLGQPGEVL